MRGAPRTARLRVVQLLYVLFHSPGPAWNHDLAYLEQPGIEDHIAFMRSLTVRDLMILGGPFADGGVSGAVGMAAIRAEDLAEAQQLALEDRSVELGLLTVTVRPWRVPMGSALASPAQADEDSPS